MQGVIVKGIAGFYYIAVKDKGIIECKAKGLFRNIGVKPLVGDYVDVDILDEIAKKGIINNLLPRKNHLIRPEVANVDQVLVVFSIAKPSPNLNLLDRYIIMMSKKQIPVIIIFNKIDLVDEKEIKYLEEIYQNSNCKVIFSHAKNGIEDTEVKTILEGKISAIAGPSGVGKSTMINQLQDNTRMQVGEISDKISRGKHTTRHSELICINDDTFIIDTPGFSALDLMDIEKEDLANYYPEFIEYENECKFSGCAHIFENECGIKNALERGEISQIRYDNYVQLYNEIKGKRKY